MSKKSSRADRDFPKFMRTFPFHHMSVKVFGALTACVIGLSSLMVAFPGYAAQTSCPALFANGQAPDVVNVQMLNRAQELCFSEFAVLHSGLTKGPLWSAEILTRQRVVDAASVDRDDVFHAESSVPAADRAELEDYVRSGYDRGHLAPAANMASIKAQDESFSLANMIPQQPDLNRRLWAQMESTARALTSNYDQVYVVTGPAFLSKRLKRLNGRVIVPTHVFKALYVPQVNGAAVWWAENDGDGKSFEVISLAQLRERAGVDVFPGLSEEVKSNALPLPEPKTYSNRSNHAKTAKSDTVSREPVGSVTPSETGWLDYAIAILNQLIR